MNRWCPGVRFPPFAAFGGSEVPPNLAGYFVGATVDRPREVLPPLRPLFAVRIDRIEAPRRIGQTPRPNVSTDKP
eukprot:15453684-Alexandrium_andersonii.AAC.1